MSGGVTGAILSVADLEKRFGTRRVLAARRSRCTSAIASA